MNGEFTILLGLAIVFGVLFIVNNIKYNNLNASYYALQKQYNDSLSGAVAVIPQWKQTNGHDAVTLTSQNVLNTMYIHTTPLIDVASMITFPTAASLIADVDSSRKKQGQEFFMTMINVSGLGAYFTQNVTGNTLSGFDGSEILNLPFFMLGTFYVIRITLTNISSGTEAVLYEVIERGSYQ